MSRSYTFKPELKKSFRKTRMDRKVILSDFDIEFIELSLGPAVHLKI